MTTGRPGCRPDASDVLPQSKADTYCAASMSIAFAVEPADLPVRAPVKFELAINLKIAKSLGFDVSLFLQQRADEVIE